MLRLGILGAARIAPYALVKPARVVGGVEVGAIAARDPRRAVQFALRHGIPTVHDSYADLVSDPSLDAIYIPLPNSLHYEWTMRSLAAGKHVLCEKPIASNSREAVTMANAAEDTGRILMEAFHYRYHPLADRMRNIINDGTIGTVSHIETYMCSILGRRNDIRFQFNLAGGALMDMGCYAVHMTRYLAGTEPVVECANALLWSPSVDRRMDARLVFPDGVTAQVACSLFSHTLLRIQAIVHGEHGELRVTNPILPQYGHLIQIRTEHRNRWEHVSGGSTYAYQLRSFIDAVRTGIPPVTDGWDAVANMLVIDAVYRSAGLPVRGEPQTSDSHQKWTST